MNFALFLTSSLSAILFSFALDAQEDYGPEFLIPYNDHGKWGFSDTLGNVKVEPQFESASFMIDNKWFHYARIEREGEETFFIANEGVVAPEGYTAEPSFFYRFLGVNNLSIIEKEGKKGLFDYHKQEIVVPVEFDDVELDPNENLIYFLKGENVKKRTLIKALNLYTWQLEKLRFVELRFEWVEVDSDLEAVYLLRNKGKKWFIHYEDGWYESPYAEEDFTENIRESYTTESEAPPQRLYFTQVPSYLLEGFEDAVVHSSMRVSYNTDYKVLYKDSGFGLVKDEETLLPFEYDYIDIDYFNGFFYLLKGGKMGVHIPLTAYPTITPKYEVIVLDRKLQVSDSWNFAIFKVKIGDHEGYVGENGVDFFNFD